MGQRGPAFLPALLQPIWSCWWAQPTVSLTARLPSQVRELGWEWSDQGDLDFERHFAERGLPADSQHRQNMERYQLWVASGMKENFSTWSRTNQEEQLRRQQQSTVGAEEPGSVATALESTSEEAHAIAAEHGSPKPAEVVNCELIGSGLELVYEPGAHLPVTLLGSEHP